MSDNTNVKSTNKDDQVIENLVEEIKKADSEQYASILNQVRGNKSDPFKLYEKLCDVPDLLSRVKDYIPKDFFGVTATYDEDIIEFYKDIKKHNTQDIVDITEKLLMREAMVTGSLKLTDQLKDVANISDADVLIELYNSNQLSELPTWILENIYHDHDLNSKEKLNISQKDYVDHIEDKIRKYNDYNLDRKQELEEFFTSQLKNSFSDRDVRRLYQASLESKNEVISDIIMNQFSINTLQNTIQLDKKVNVENHYVKQNDLDRKKVTFMKKIKIALKRFFSSKQSRHKEDSKISQKYNDAQKNPITSKNYIDNRQIEEIRKIMQNNKQCADNKPRPKEMLGKKNYKTKGI